MKTKTIVLTIPEAKHLLTLLADAAERGDYYGNRTQYWRRHQRIIDKLEHAPEDQAMTDQTPDTIRALADRLERRADIEDVGEVRYPQEDVPEVTWEEMREIVGLLREAASTLRALART